MISLSIVVLTFAIIFTGLFFVFRMNSRETAPKAPRSERRKPMK